jgi:GNAT superfamily N-acetyltransferase
MAACTPHYSADHMTAWFAGRTHEIYRPAIDAGQIWLDALDAPDGRVRGFVGAIPGEITLLFVDPACAGQGLGQRLFEAGWRLAAQGSDQVQVMSTLNAVTYYAARGFEPVASVHFERGTPPLRFPVLHMRRTVLPRPPESPAT